MSNINYQELANYLQTSQNLKVSQVDIMRVERLCVEKKLQPTERLVAYASAAMIQFNIPADQAIDLASKSMGLDMRTFIDSLMTEAFNQLAPIAEQGAHAVRAQLTSHFKRHLFNSQLSAQERGQIQSVASELSARFEVTQLEAQEMPRGEQLSLSDALEEMRHQLNANDQRQLPGI